ncbi:MAG: hypothetical protein RL033_4039, partial [Pseudomonadota bacterium]
MGSVGPMRVMTESAVLSAAYTLAPEDVVRLLAGDVERGVFQNHWLWAAVGLSLLLQVAVVQVGALNVAFSTAPLSARQW